MSDFAMDLNTNDLLIVGGDLQIATGTDAIAQRLQQSLQLWLGEWFLDTTRGVPYRQQVFVKNPNLDIIQADLVIAATNVPGVVQVTGVSFDFDSTSRTLSVEMEVQDSNGQTITVSPSIAVPTNQTIQGTPR